MPDCGWIKDEKTPLTTSTIAVALRKLVVRRHSTPFCALMIFSTTSRYASISARLNA